jgi:hypothetical protein
MVTPGNLKELPLVHYYLSLSLSEEMYTFTKSLQLKLAEPLAIKINENLEVTAHCFSLA